MSDKPKDELDEDGLRALQELSRRRAEPVRGDALSILGNAASKLYRATSETAPYTKPIDPAAVLHREGAIPPKGYDPLNREIRRYTERELGENERPTEKTTVVD